MNENPYDILGISQDASIEEVKRAYRKKARENHPDLNPGDPDAQDRMNKINEAYERIINPEKFRASDARKRGYGAPYSPSSPYGGPNSTTSQGGQAGAGGSQGPSGPNPYGYGPGNAGGPFVWTVNFDDFFQGYSSSSRSVHPEPIASDSAEIRSAIADINSNNPKGAIETLQRIESTGRNARWYYLFSIANNLSGNTVAAHDAIRRARQMDPSNQDYMRFESMLARQAQNYQQTGQGRGFQAAGCDPNMLCCLICLMPTICPTLTRTCLYGGFLG